MRTFTVGLIAVLGFVASGCMRPQQGDMFAKPTPGPEQAKLQRFVGTWVGTAEMISPTVEEMNAMLPEGKKVGATMKGGEKWEWVSGGMVLRGEGWHDLPGGDRENWVGYVVWDAGKKAYRSWWVSDTGTVMEGQWKLADDGNTMHATSKSIVGPKSHGSGSFHFVDDRKGEWEWTEHSPMGKMKMKGTNEKQ